MNRLIIYVVLFVGGAVAVWWYGESREEDGYNRAVAEHSQAVAEWHEEQEKAYQEALAEERRRATLLSDELSQLRGDYESLQAEVSHAQVVKPRDDVPGSLGDLCADYNPLGPAFVRLLNAGARGAFGTPEADSRAGDGEMP